MPWLFNDPKFLHEAKTSKKWLIIIYYQQMDQHKIISNNYKEIWLSEFI